MRAALFFIAGPLLLAALFSNPASAQWSRIPNIPMTDVFAVWTNADTIVAGIDTAAFVSTDAGVHWKRSSKPTPAVVAVDALWIRNGRLYVGTFGQGVFVSNNFGDTWQPFNEGLVGGIFNSQLQVLDLQARGDSLYVATAGAGVYVRGFAAGSSWHHFGEQFEPFQASNVSDLALGGSRLLASGGGNGTTFHRDTGDAEWTVSFLGNLDIVPGLLAQSAIWTGAGWVVGTNVGVFRSVAGQEPWTPSGPNLGGIGATAFATKGRRVFAAFDRPNSVFLETSGDDGASWQVLEELPLVFVYQLAVIGNELYAARHDGLWIRSIATVSVPPGGEAESNLQFSLAGPQPVQNDVRLRFELAEAGSAVLDVFDVLGRRVGDRIQGSYAAGPHEISWSARGLSPGVYAARLSVGGKHGVVRLVHVR